MRGRRRVVIGCALIALAAPVAAQAPRGGPVPDREPAVVTRARLDTSAVVNFRVLVLPETVYVGQQATYELGVFLDNSVRDRLRRMEAIAPEMRGMLAYEPPAPSAGFPMRVVGQHRYEAHVYERAVFPLAAGRLAIPPARLVYSMPLSFSFFSREETYDLRSDSAILVAIEPPLEGRPADWTGAVGSLQVSARVDTAVGRVGDPMMLTVTVAGRGNVNLLPRPHLELSWATAVPGDERVLLSSDSLDIHGEKQFDWVITPQRAGRAMVPGVRYPYFDPDARRYEVAATMPLAVTIVPGTLAAADTGPAQPRLSIRTQYRGALPRGPLSQAPFWWLVLAAPVPAALVLIGRRPRRVRRSTSPARTLLALTQRRDGEPAASPRELRRAFLRATAARLRSPVSLRTWAPSMLAEPRALERAARRAGVTTSTASAAASLIEELNAAAFGASPAPPPDIASRVERVYLAIDREACRVRVHAAALIVLLVVGASAGRALAADRDAAQFARGVEAYQTGNARLAVREFADLAARVPHAADAWADLGTAAFAAGDTARATLGWQHALRLEPSAGDVRDRLETLGAASGNAAVPGVPATPFAIVAIVLWLAGWSSLAWRARRRTLRAHGSAIAAMLLAAAATGTIAVSIDARLAASDLAVVMRDVPLYQLPSLGADRGATVRAGEVARVIDRQGVWSRIGTDGGRRGWAETDALASLARD